MRINIESTQEILVVNGVPARVWLGETDDGKKVEALICILKPAKGEEPQEFDEELLRLRRAASLMRNPKRAAPLIPEQPSDPSS